MLKLVNHCGLRSVLRLGKNNIRLSSTAQSDSSSEHQPIQKHPSRPKNWKSETFTNVIESREEFEKFVKPILPNFMVPDPPKHDSYPTPSGWVPPDYTKSSRLPYFVMRTRFHQFPIYPEEKDGSWRFVRIRYVEGDIWVRLCDF